MKNILITLFFTQIFNLAFSQEIEVQYDVVTQNINVINFKKNDTLHTKEIKLKPGSMVRFVLSNYNSEALEIERVSKKAITIDSSLMSRNQTAILSFFQNKFVAPSFGSEFTSVLENLTKTRSERVPPKASDRILVDQDELNNLPFYNSEELSLVINSRLQALSKVVEANLALKKLRFEVNLPEIKIKSSATNTIDFFDADTKRLLKNENNQVEAFKRLKKIASENALELELATGALLQATQKDTLAKSRGSNSNLANQIKIKNYVSLKKASESMKEDSIWSLLVDIYKDYHIIFEKNYTYNFSTIADVNNDLLNINFYQLQNPDLSVKKKELIKSETFRFKMKDLRLVNSAGIIFVNYFKTPENYTLNNGKVVATEADKITPVISTMINVISSSDAPIKIGGDFGIGVAVNESKAVHFMLGPSITLGRTNLLNLHFGITTCRLTRLSQGYTVGSIISGSEIPKINRYELGSFFGLSFNLASLTSKK